jgi:hypothetical protein
MQIFSGKEANKKGSKQHATSNRQVCHEKESKQHATSNKQACHEKESFRP